MIELGKKAKDKVTGFTGIITARITYIYGCDQYGISPKVGKDGKLGDCTYFDEGRIKILGKGFKPKDVQVEENGGPSRTIKSRRD